MTNEEIDTRLKLLSQAIPLHAKKLLEMNEGKRTVVGELELMNMSLMAIWAMLGEIAKRLPPEPK